MWGQSKISYLVQSRQIILGQKWETKAGLRWNAVRLGWVRRKLYYLMCWYFFSWKEFWCFHFIQTKKERISHLTFSFFTDDLSYLNSLHLDHLHWCICCNLWLQFTGCLDIAFVTEPSQIGVSHFAHHLDTKFRPHIFS